MFVHCITSIIEFQFVDENVAAFGVIANKFADCKCRFLHFRLLTVGVSVAVAELRPVRSPPPPPNAHKVFDSCCWFIVFESANFL